MHCPRTRSPSQPLSLLVQQLAALTDHCSCGGSEMLTSSVERCWWHTNICTAPGTGISTNAGILAYGSDYREIQSMYDNKWAAWSMKELYHVCNPQAGIQRWLDLCPCPTPSSSPCCRPASSSCLSAPRARSRGAWCTCPGSGAGQGPGGGTPPAGSAAWV